MKLFGVSLFENTCENVELNLYSFSSSNLKISISEKYSQFLLLRTLYLHDRELMSSKVRESVIKGLEKKFL